MMGINTEVTYLYRDYSNYKIVNSVVIPGHILPEQIQTILDCLNDGQNFIPRQVWLPETRFGNWTEDDTVWFELHDYDFTPTDRPATVDITAEQLVENFLAAKDCWDEDEARSEIWRED